jgi:drug/metabolite transporter (DMT)-like permease
MSKNLKIWLALIFLYLAWGSLYLAIHFLVESVPPILASGSRNLLAGLILFGYAVFQKDFKFPTLNAWFWVGLAGILMLSVGNGFLTVAVKWVPSGYAALFPALIPIWLVIIQFFIDGTKPKLLTLIGCILGVIGVGFLLSLQQLALKGYEQYFFQGVVLLVIATLGWSAGVIVATKKTFDYPIVIIAAIQMIVGGAILLIFSELYGELDNFSVAQIKPEAYKSFLFLLVVGSLLGFTIFNWVSQKASPTLVATYNYVNPLVAITLGTLFANEPFNTQLLIAAALIIGAVFLITKKE